MLKLEDIRFPITFDTLQGFITFTTPTRGVWHEGEDGQTSLPIKSFIEGVNSGKETYKMAPVSAPALQYTLLANDAALIAKPKTLAEALDYAEHYAKETGREVTILNHFATVKPKTTITAEVIYA